MTDAFDDFCLYTTGRTTAELMKNEVHVADRFYEVRAVLAGAYRGGPKGKGPRQNQPTVTHYYDVTGEECGVCCDLYPGASSGRCMLCDDLGRLPAPTTLCGRIVQDHLSDVAEEHPATCSACVRRLAGLEKKARKEAGR